VLCLAPQGAVLATTDGYYRLVDSYGLYTIEEMAQRCRTDGLASLMDELLAFEAARASGSLAVKSADDASAVLWTGPARKESE
jgi:hypothetical protein